MNNTSNGITLKIVGWRGVSHSYALVNQFQMLAFLKSGLTQIHHVDIPFILPHWGVGQNPAGLNQTDEKLLSDLSSQEAPSCIYKIYAPLELKGDPTLPTVTFVVTELGLDTDRHPLGFAQQYADMGGKIHTPSQWSKQRLMCNGMPEHMIHVIPHAADSSYFFTLPTSEIELNRSNLGLHPEDVMLLNVGTHHWNKGLDVLLKAFVMARQINPRLKLVLKDQQTTYLMDSKSYINETIGEYIAKDDQLIHAIKLISGHLNLAQLNTLYNIADAYVSPYRAEGFNLPALEAQTCGTPVVATRGGATDDFLQGSNYHPIRGQLIENNFIKEHLPINAYIEPDLGHWVEVLSSLDRKQSVAQMHPGFQWVNACQELMELM